MPNYIAKYFLILLILANPGYLQGWLDLLPWILPPGAGQDERGSGGGGGLQKEYVQGMNWHYFQTGGGAESALPLKTSRNLLNPSIFFYFPKSILKRQWNNKINKELFVPTPCTNEQGDKINCECKFKKKMLLIVQKGLSLAVKSCMLLSLILFHIVPADWRLLGS